MPSKVTQMSKNVSSTVLANKLKNIINYLMAIRRTRTKLVGVVSKWGTVPFPPPLCWKTAFSLQRQPRTSAWRSMFQACCASKNVRFPGRFEHRHPELHKVKLRFWWGGVASQLHCFRLKGALFRMKSIESCFFGMHPNKVIVWLQTRLQTRQATLAPDTAARVYLNSCQQNPSIRICITQCQENFLSWGAFFGNFGVNLYIFYQKLGKMGQRISQFNHI